MNLAETRTHEPLVNNPKEKKAKRAMPKTSKKRSRITREYMKLRAKFLIENPHCEWCKVELGGLVPATEIHHRKGRGSFMLDTSTWYAVSHQGHLWIHSNPKYAYEKGYMLPRR